MNRKLMTFIECQELHIDMQNNQNNNLFGKVGYCVFMWPLSFGFLYK